MSGDIECDVCDVCKKELPVTRKYYRYEMKCNCCNGENDNHFETVKHCSECEPKPPRTVIALMTPKE